MYTLTVVIPCFNEEKTLERCVERVLTIADAALTLEVIVVDDGSSDRSLSIARDLELRHSEIRVLAQGRNRGKGAALKAGFQEATGDFVAVQDADLEYDPVDLKNLLAPLIDNKADVVFGSRFLAGGPHRVLYFWHSLGNRFLTFLSNMFTDLNLTDMETCYKVFKREVVQGIDIQEERFGFEPEIVAKVAQMRLRVYEMGVSYYGRTYQEGKKIGAIDGLRAIYCIFRYNAHRAPLPLQFLFYLCIGGFSAVINLMIFLIMDAAGWPVAFSAPTAFILAALVNYFLCILLLFRHRARWDRPTELILYWGIVCLVCLLDLGITRAALNWGMSPGVSKLAASCVVLVLNFSGRRFMVFPEPSSGPWSAQDVTHDDLSGGSPPFRSPGRG